MSDDSEIDNDECWNCGGEGFYVAACFEDTCCCADPELEHDLLNCWVCNGRGIIRLGGDMMDITKLAERFLGWPLPASVCSDLCATKQGYPNRSGTNLLSAVEAKQMFEYVLAELSTDHDKALADVRRAALIWAAAEIVREHRMDDRDGWLDLATKIRQRASEGE